MRYLGLFSVEDAIAQSAGMNPPKLLQVDLKGHISCGNEVSQPSSVHCNGSQWIVNSGALLPDPAGADCGLLNMIVSRFGDDLK
jgi:hypothetical protein